MTVVSVHLRSFLFSPVLLAILGIAVVIAPFPVRADSFCGAGRHVGAENDGAGKSWVCVPDAPASVPSSAPRYSSGGGGGGGRNSVSTGLGAAGAALDLFNALSSILDSPSSGGGGQRGPTEADLIQQKIQQEYAERDARSKAEGAAFADRARKAAQGGDYDRARDDFRKAYEASGVYDYSRDMTAMDALSHLQVAINLSGKADTDKAYTEFIKAETLAKGAFRPDIAQNIERYRTELFKVIMGDDLAKDAQGARDASKKLTTQCVPVNGEFICD